MKSPARNHGRISVNLQKALLSYDTNPIYVYDLSGKKKKKKGNMVVSRGELGRGRGVSLFALSIFHFVPYEYFTYSESNT